MTFGFEEMAYELPTTLVEIEELAQEADIDEEMVEKLKSGGLKKIPISTEKNLAGLVSKAIYRLSDRDPRILADVRGIIFAHSLPVICPQDISFLDKCLKGHELDEKPRVAVSGQPCSILHFATRLAGHWLNRVPEGGGILLLGGDQVYSAKDRIFFGSAMGDAAMAGLITRESKRNRVISCISNTHIICFQGEDSPEEDIAQFRLLAPQLIRQSIMECLRKATVALDDLKYIVPHTPYNAMWDPIATLLRFPRENILTHYIGETGHLNSNDSIIHYIRAVNDEKIEEGDLALLINPGFGGTCGCTLIQR